MNKTFNEEGISAVAGFHIGLYPGRRGKHFQEKTLGGKQLNNNYFLNLY